MNAFSFKLLKTLAFKGVTIDFYTSTDGYFVETSQGLVSEYMKTKNEVREYIKNVKHSIKTDNNYEKN